MSNSLEANRRKLEEMKARRANRQQQGVSDITETNQSQIRVERRQHSIQKSEDIHVSGTLIQTYDMEIQCALETRSLDSKAHKEIENEEKIDLLQPKEKKRKEDKREEVHVKEIQELTGEQLTSLVKSKHFTDFFNRSSKVLEKVLDHGDGDMIELLLRDGIKSKDRSTHDILAHSLTFSDPNYTTNRVVTDFDWSPQISELFLTSYGQNEERSIKDHVGVVLIWNPQLKNRPQFYCFCQSAVTSSKFYPFSNSTVLGGCYNGQILLWDLRAKSMPVQRSGISADAHKYPVTSINVVGTQIANNIVSFSNDGMSCLWDIKQFSKPTRTSKVSATRTIKAQPKMSVLTSGGSLLASKSMKVDVSTTSILDKTTSKEEAHDVNITCCEFPAGDANNYYLGSLNGVLYKNALHNKATDKVVLYDQHNGPVSGVSVNRPSQFEALNGLVLTSAFDWTIKLWGPHRKDSIRTFEHSEDYIYDVCWNPNNPSLFASVNNDGYIDIFDLTRDLQLPIAHQAVNKYAQNKCKWNHDGSAIVSGDSQGNVNLFILAEKYRRMEASKYEDLEKVIHQSQEVV